MRRGFLLLSNRQIKVFIPLLIHLLGFRTAVPSNLSIRPSHGTGRTAGVDQAGVDAAIFDPPHCGQDGTFGGAVVRFFANPRVLEKSS